MTNYLLEQVFVCWLRVCHVRFWNSVWDTGFGLNCRICEKNISKKLLEKTTKFSILWQRSKNTNKIYYHCNMTWLNYVNAYNFKNCAQLEKFCCLTKNINPHAQPSKNIASFVKWISHIPLNLLIGVLIPHCNPCWYLVFSTRAIISESVEMHFPQVFILEFLLDNIKWKTCLQFI